MFLSLAVAYDPATRRCDLVRQGRGLLLDRTAATPLLLAIGTDRRAEPDDTLPDGVTEGSLQAGFVQRRGSAGDRLAVDGHRMGSRLWLLARAKLGNADPVTGGSGVTTMQDAEAYAIEATNDFQGRYGLEVTVAASRPARNALLLQVQAGQQVLSVRRAV